MEDELFFKKNREITNQSSKKSLKFNKFTNPLTDSARKIWNKEAPCSANISVRQLFAWGISAVIIPSLLRYQRFCKSKDPICKHSSSSRYEIGCIPFHKKALIPKIFTIDKQSHGLESLTQEWKIQILGLLKFLSISFGNPPPTIPFFLVNISFALEIIPWSLLKCWLSSIRSENFDRTRSRPMEISDIPNHVKQLLEEALLLYCVCVVGARK